VGVGPRERQEEVLRHEYTIRVDDLVDTSSADGREWEAFRDRARQTRVEPDQAQPRVVMQFPANPNDMLLSGTLANGQYLSNRALAIDQPLGNGHVVMFALRPFWRWQTQGTYFLGFNAILNWNDLDAGKAVAVGN
jgi:hypothetical protein